MRIIPSAGFAFIPEQPSGIETITKNNQTSYAYKAGAWNTAFITGAGFEFGSNTSAKFIINVNYLKGLGNMDTETINNVSNGKPSATSISSKTSGWNISLGIPLSFNKKKPKIVERKIEYRKCGQYQRPQFHGRCGQYRMFDR